MVRSRSLLVALALATGVSGAAMAQAPAQNAPVTNPQFWQNDLVPSRPPPAASQRQPESREEDLMPDFFL